jgi:hypothetical protein
MEYALATRQSLKRTFLVHGEQRGADPLMIKLNQAGLKNLAFPALHQKVEIGGPSTSLRM